MERYYLAIDIGASSGRHMLGHIENGKMILEEIWRFENGMKDREGSLCWDLDALFEEIKTGMKRCKELGKIPVSMGIDTWAVDYVLLDEKDQVLGKPMDTVTAALREWMRMYIRSFRKKSFTAAPESRSRALIPFIS